MTRARLSILAFAAGAAVFAQVHRAEQDREIRYWLLDPESHRFHISHDFTVSLEGQKSVHSFVRAGSEVAPDSRMFDLDTGEALHTHLVSGAEVNALGYYPTPTDPKSMVVQGDLPVPVEEGQSVRIRVEETYADPVGYKLDGAELVWKRTLGRPVNDVTLPAGLSRLGYGSTPKAASRCATSTRVTEISILRFTHASGNRRAGLSPCPALLGGVLQARCNHRE